MVESNTDREEAKLTQTSTFGNFFRASERFWKTGIITYIQMLEIIQATTQSNYFFGTPVKLAEVICREGVDNG
jgi:hypothetical protein